MARGTGFGMRPRGFLAGQSFFRFALGDFPMLFPFSSRLPLLHLLPRKTTPFCCCRMPSRQQGWRQLAIHSSRYGSERQRIPSAKCGSCLRTMHCVNVCAVPGAAPNLLFTRNAHHQLTFPQSHPYRHVLWRPQTNLDI